MAHSLFDELQRLGYAPKDYGTYYRMAALYRGGKNPLALCVRKTDGQFKDFGASGTFPASGTRDVLMKLASGDASSLAAIVPELSKQRIKKKLVFSEDKLKELFPYWDLYTTNGISEATMRLFEAGLDNSGKLNRRICFPVYDSARKIVGFAGRWHQKETPTKSTPKWKILGDKRGFVYPVNLNKSDEKMGVILVESIGCVVRLRECGITNAFCLFGVHLQKGLLKYLLVNQVPRVFVCTNNEVDNDSIGNKAAEDIRKKLLGYYDESKINVALPPKKDFFDMSNEEVTDWYSNLCFEYA